MVFWLMAVLLVQRVGDAIKQGENIYKIAMAGERLKGK
jgi:hypothetical protein